MNVALDAIVARLMPGDEVTATFRHAIGGETFVVGGTIWVTDIGSLAVGYQVVRFTDGLPGPDLRDLVITKPAPDPEPPIGSVVLDDEGDAWQSFRFGREAVWRSVGDDSVLSWERFTDIFGPVRVVYTPEATP